MVTAPLLLRATSMDVAEWLRGLGLDQYVSAFRANDIDAEVLRRLTAEDLRELGVASARLNWPYGSIQRTCTTSSPPIIAASPR